MINRMWWSAALIILVSGLLTWVFMAHLHGRLSMMAAAARRIQEGALSDRLQVGVGGDELDALAMRFNEAFDEIARRIEATQHLSSALAHDMRRPLTALHNALEEALADTPPSHPLHRRLEALATQTGEQLHTFAALLRLARLEAGAWQGARMECDLAEIAADAVELYAPWPNAKAARSMSTAAPRWSRPTPRCSSSCCRTCSKMRLPTAAATSS